MIRESTMASNSQIAAETTGCIFCGAPDGDAPLKVDLYKIVRRENRYVVVGIQCQTQYQTTSIEVPRCRKCQRSHDRLGLSVLIPGVALIAALVVAVNRLWLLSAGESGIVVTLKLVFFVVVAGYMGLVAVGLVVMTVELVAHCLGFNTERRARDVEPIKSLLAAGWELGDKPPYKGGDVRA